MTRLVWLLTICAWAPDSVTGVQQTGLVCTDITAGDVEQFVGLLNKVEEGNVQVQERGRCHRQPLRGDLFFGSTIGRRHDSHTQSSEELR
jgi:hypothetical protein